MNSQINVELVIESKLRFVFLHITDRHKTCSSILITNRGYLLIYSFLNMFLLV